ncbi:BQ2448_1645 [Microbotryum intermedium]|uniref:BQ2448_1645 protein n=1 Tax=Microbotryum intermedium TaxID=269621 RepID=A0A238FDP5_9BASI|nr:BQ2448_1645 [Microbotryum intermedium]
MHLIDEPHVNIPAYPSFANRLQSSASTRRSALTVPPRIPLQANIINQTWLQQKDHRASSDAHCHPSHNYPSPESITSELPEPLSPTPLLSAPLDHQQQPNTASSRESVVEQGRASGGARDVKCSSPDGLTPPPQHCKRSRTRSYSVSSHASTVDSHRSNRSSSFGTSLSSTASSSNKRSSSNARAVSKAYESRRCVADALRAAIQSGRVNAATVSNETVSRIVEGARHKAAKQGSSGEPAQHVGGQDRGHPREQIEQSVHDNVKQVVRNAVSVEESGEIEVDWDELGSLGQYGRNKRRNNKMNVKAVPVEVQRLL